LPPDYGAWDPLSQSQYLETAHLLPGCLLSSQGDRVAMAHSVDASRSLRAMAASRVFEGCFDDRSIGICT